MSKSKQPVPIANAIDEAEREQARITRVLQNWPEEREAGIALVLNAITPKFKPFDKPETIREHLKAMPNKAGHEYIKEACRDEKISLDGSWPPRISYAENFRKNAVILEFPKLFGEDTRAVSNIFSKCPVFSAVKERQNFLDYVVIGYVSNIKIEFAGEQFNQDDHDTFMQLVKMAEGTPLGGWVRVSVNTVLSELGRHTQKEQRKQLFEQVSRLFRGSLRVTLPNMPSVEMRLFGEIMTPIGQDVLPRYQRHLAYRLDERLDRFYRRDAFTVFDVKQRIKLTGRGSELAKALHLWIIGNATQYPIKVETLRDKVGSRQKDIKEFRRNLRVSLDLLKREGIINDWRIDDADIVHIDRTPSESQQRYLDANK